VHGKGMAILEQSELLNQLHIDRQVAEPTTRRPTVVTLALIAAILVGIGAWWMVGPIAVTPIQTAIARRPPQANSKPTVLEASGYVTARRQATVAAKVTGKVSQVLIEEGQHVQEGQVLAWLDDRDAAAQLAVSKAQLDAARAQLADIRVQLAQAQRDLTRQNGLVERGLTSQQAAEQARSSVESLLARVSAQNNQVRVAEQSLKVAEVNLDNLIVRAPFAGVIVAKTAQLGEVVSPESVGGGFTRTGIGTIVDMASLQIDVDVNEALIGRVHLGQPVMATLNAHVEWKIPGEVIAIIPMADRAKATVKVRIAFRQKDPRVVPDMGVRVNFLNEAKKGEEVNDWQMPGVLVPSVAIREDEGTAVVFVYANSKLERRVVQVGKTIDENTQVLAGVHEGEHVVLSPTATLKDGDRAVLRQKG
jgi:RND family efflux transporter MFP subunit